jgi:protein subunit release factor A
MEQILNQILFEMKNMRADVNELKEVRADVSELKEMRADVNDLKNMREDMEDLKVIRADLNDLKEGQKRLEIGQEKLQKNLITSLELYTDKIVEHFDASTEVLNKRVYKVETEIERLSR